MQLAIKLNAEELESWWSNRASPRLVEFYAPWCIYHLLTKKKIEALQHALGNDVELGEFEVTGYEELVSSYGIQHVPTMVYIDAGIQLTWAGDTDLCVMLSDIAKALDGGETA